ncbi:MAG: response regulator [Myxococcaceae bacterium]
MSNTILLVDDSPCIRSIIKLYLMGLDFEFVEAESAGRALHLLRLLPPKLAIVDVNMPGMDGLSFVLEVRARANGPAFPIIVLTSDQSPDLEARAAAVGANSLLRKPISRDGLLAAVRRFIPERAASHA